MATESRQNEEKGNSPPLLKIQIEGPQVGNARLSASTFIEIIKRTQQALQRVAQVLYGEESTGQGRKKKEIEGSCELFLVGWQRGSAIAEMEIGEPPEQLDLLESIGRASLNAFVDGVGVIRNFEDPPSTLPPGFDTGVLQACDALGKVLDHGIDKISFLAQDKEASEAVIYDPTTREHVRALLHKPADISSVSKVGRLEMLNGHGKLTGTLWEAGGTRWACHFSQEHLDTLSGAFFRTVRLSGKTEDKEHTLHVYAIQIIDEEFSREYGAEQVFPFWKSMTLEALAEQQGISENQNIDEIGELWPIDDDPEEILQHILADRQARRDSSIDGNGN